MLTDTMRGLEHMATVGLCFPGEPTAIHPDAFFAGPDSQLYWQAQELCMKCPLYFDCQEDARTEGIPYGIWGGETASSRKRFWEKNGGRPDLFDRAIKAFTGTTGIVVMEDVA